MCLSFTVVPATPNVVGADRLSRASGLSIVKLRGALHFSYGGKGCGCPLLTKSAEFTSEFWDLEPNLLSLLEAALEIVAREAHGFTLGAVWAGDTRDGFNGCGDLVRWVVDEADAEAAREFFASRCDRVRVQPFLDGVPCSIHGMVLPDGTAAFRPVEIAMLRDRAARSFVYGGLSSFWDPPAADRAEMRSVAQRVGGHLAAAHSYRGAFGIDGVLTAEGFRPTELNPRFSMGLTALAAVAPVLLQLLQDNLLAGRSTGVTVHDVETLVPLMDAQRTGRPHVLVPGRAPSRPSRSR